MILHVDYRVRLFTLRSRLKSLPGCSETAAPLASPSELWFKMSSLTVSSIRRQREGPAVTGHFPRRLRLRKWSRNELWLLIMIYLGASYVHTHTHQYIGLHANLHTRKCMHAYIHNYAYMLNMYIHIHTCICSCVQTYI